MTSTRLYRFFLLAILLLAFALRVIALDHIPPGLSHDEAYNGITAIQVLSGQRAIFFEINKGIEPLIIYLEALAFAAFGIGPVPMRLVNVFCGMLTVALVYPLTVRLFNRRVALLAMTGVAVSFWAIFVSRLALRAVILPPLLLLTLYFYRRGLSSTLNVQRLTFNLQPSTFFFALSGLTAGAAMYTYLSSRFVPVLLAVIFGFQLLLRRVTRWHWLGLALLFFIWAMMFAPLANYFWQHQASFSERSSQVSTIPYALNGDFGPMLRHTLRTLGMFTFHGDETDRYNLDSRPVFDWLNGLFFYLGLGLTLFRLFRRPNQAESAAFVLLWFLVMLLPGFITDDSPHFLRTIGAMPAVYILWALGVSRVTCHVSRFTPVSLLILVLILFNIVYTSYDYFIHWAEAPGARSIYGADVAEAAQFLKSSTDKDLPVISAEYYRDLDPFRLALHTHNQPPFVLWFDGRQTLAFPPPQSSLNPRYLFLDSAPPAEEWQPFLQPVPAESGRAYQVYRLTGPAARQQTLNELFPPETRLGLNVNNDLILSGTQMLGSVVSGGKFRVLLGWQALRTLPPGTDYTFLVRLKDQQGFIWAEADGNGFAPGDWQPGVQGLQLLTLRLPGDLPPRAYSLTVEVVDRHSGQALPGSNGESVISLLTLPGQLAATPRLIEADKLPNPIPLDSETETSAAITLRGHKITHSTVHPGDALPVTLHWQTVRQPAQNYRLSFTLVKDAEQVIYQWPPLEPIGGEWPTSQWPTGYWVQDRLYLPIPSDIPTGSFTLHIAWLTSENQLLPGFNLDQITVTP
jgi:4-amino-4-deoxy-L-arabinose transferase-like glycosyltransferase